MDNVIEEVKPGQVVAAIDPAFVELEEYMNLLGRACQFRADHPRLQRLLETQEIIGVNAQRDLKAFGRSIL